MVNPEQVRKDDESLGFRADSDFMFSDAKQRYRERVERRQRKLARKTPFLGRFLEQDEKIRLLATACSPMSIWEQLLTGSIIIYIKRALFAFTNKRIFHVLTTWRYAYRNSLAEIRYVDCRSIRLRSRTLLVEYKNARKEKFYYVSRRERKKIKDLLKSVSLEGAPSASQERTHLCPWCTHVLEKDRYTCPSCRLEFKDKAEGRRISLIYPGGGYFYTRHPYLGIGDALTELFLTLVVVVSLVNVIRGVAGAGADLFIWSIILAIEKAITVFHSNHFIKEYIPKEKTIEPRKRAS